MSTVVLAATAGALAATAASSGHSEPLDQAGAVLILATLVVALLGGAVKARFPSWWESRPSAFVFGALCTLMGEWLLLLLVMLIGTALGY